MEASSPADDVARRRARRRELIARARRFAEDCRARGSVRAAVVFGSVARGDWNDESDIDVLVVADWQRERRRGNPIVAEALAHGVWLVGGPTSVAGEDPP